MRKPTRPQTILRHAARRVRKGWTREALARTKAGHPVCPNHKYATKWCAIGAISAVLGYSSLPGWDNPAIVALADTIKRRSRSSKVFSWDSSYDVIYTWNDKVARNVEQVASMLERAADAIESGKIQVAA